jgi:outer membrane protein insertion porin family
VVEPTHSSAKTHVVRLDDRRVASAREVTPEAGGVGHPAADAPHRQDELAPIDIREDGGRERTILTFVINEGPVYTVDGVALQGVQLFDESVLTSSFNTMAGQTYNAAFIDTDEQTIRDFYGSRGYADATVRTSLAPSGEYSVIVVFDVEEGDISFLRRINITGNDVTKDRVIRRELAVAPGEEFNTVNVNIKHVVTTGGSYWHKP